MSSRPTLQSLLDEALSEAPALSRHLLNTIQAALDSRTQYFPLLEGWRRMRARFCQDFQSALIPLIQSAGQGHDPLQQQRSAGGLDSLRLVDERQALQDVAIAHVIQAVEDQSRPELHQLGNFFAALRGTARARKNENPLRPALFAQALLQALSSTEMEPQRRYELMQVAATPMAQDLHRIYGQLCARLRAAELSQLVASHASRSQDTNAAHRFALASRHSEPATLDGLARRVQEHNTRPQGIGASASGQAPVFIAKAGPDMLSRLYDQILADPRLLAPLKALLARLQVAVVRLSRNDSSLLHRQDHPTWALLNRVAAHGMAFERADDEQFQSFLRSMDVEVQGLIDAPLPTAMLFEQTFSRVDKMLSKQAQQRSERSAAALASLEREQLRKQWLDLLREQLRAQTADAPLGPRLRQFLQTAWAEVIVQAMVLHGRESEAAMARIEWVDELLESLHTPIDEPARHALRQRLPALIDALRSGCEAIALAADKRESVMQELMQQHSRLLRGMSALDESDTVPQSLADANGSRELSQEELLQRLLNERESQLPEHWAHTRVDRGELPTVPVQLYDQDNQRASLAAIKGWMDALHIGGWYHLFIQSDWLTAQIAWISDNQQYYLFVGQDSDERHSLTRAALERLLANGLITALDETSLLQRAVDTLMQDLAQQG
ncbi:DUF1631 family protein [Paucibacter sp. AS339]|uniref:DUF1631 family protein n=1 Tax=Paucibacter hankyongi TaxID=3133434 RepID=UPI0030AD01C0